MILVAFVAFAILLVAWLFAPNGDTKHVEAAAASTLSGAEAPA